MSALIALGLPVAPQQGATLDTGLAFDLLRSPPDGPRVVTGHTDGVVTIDIEEADSARREAARDALREPYRTVLGHLRHEAGHYYWQRLVDRGPWLASFREVFGDERADYSAALRRHYAEGPLPGWARVYVSAYASAHPWEDWAETWAHYLHMLDMLDTALSFSLDPEAVELPSDRFTEAALYSGANTADLEPAAGRDFLDLVNTWVELGAVLNELARSMGQPDLYPFVLPAAAVAKLHFVHLVVGAARRRGPQ